MRARYYDPATQQFISRDPMEGVSGQPYVYGNASPVNYVDPSGNIGILALFFMGAALNVASDVALDFTFNNAHFDLEGSLWGSVSDPLTWIPIPGGQEISPLLKAAAKRTIKGGVQRVVAGSGGRYGDLIKGAGGDLRVHHMPQQARGHLPREDGGAIVLTKGEHGLTRDFAGRGRVTKRDDAGLSFRQVLAKSIMDVHGIVGSKYNGGLLQVSNYYRENYPWLLRK